ncbi:MAG TPA: hypothetical protein PKC73_10210 [Dermatophilaceae bacterium]|jgi:hypothetical protein|nr:hypothetical protein [Actinomycetales bacterium]HMT32753.1 hypothetical protein [Dermatophilaceae bacterium]HMT90001.1 hypothetical protein [Dermatophilaceae bacterium]
MSAPSHDDASHDTSQPTVDLACVYRTDDTSPALARLLTSMWASARSMASG